MEYWTSGELEGNIKRILRRLRERKPLHPGQGSRPESKFYSKDEPQERKGGTKEQSRRWEKNWLNCSSITD